MFQVENVYKYIIIYNIYNMYVKKYVIMLVIAIIHEVLAPAVVLTRSPLAHGGPPASKVVGPEG